MLTANGWLQLALYLGVLLPLVKPLGWYMARVYAGQNVGLNRLLGPADEYLGKKIEAFEIKMASIVILIPPLTVLAFTALALALNLGGFQDGGPHGFSELLYAYTSQGNNNGSAFAGFGFDQPWHNTFGGLAMLLARFWIIVPTLAIAGSLAGKKLVPAGPGTLPTTTPLFVILLVGVVIIVGALTFLPALALGPIVEHLILSDLY